MATVGWLTVPPTSLNPSGPILGPIVGLMPGDRAPKCTSQGPRLWRRLWGRAVYTQPAPDGCHPFSGVLHKDHEGCVIWVPRCWLCDGPRMRSALETCKNPRGRSFGTTRRGLRGEITHTPTLQPSSFGWVRHLVTSKICFFKEIRRVGV